MANEFRHESTAGTTTLAQTDWEDTDIHRFDSQAKGDIPYASSATQISRLAIGTTAQPLTVSSSGAPQWGGNVQLASNKLLATDIALKRFDQYSWALRDSGDTTYKSVKLATVEFTDTLRGLDGSGDIATKAENDANVLFKAYDTDTGDAEVGRLQGAADPYFSFGGSQQFKFYYSGVGDFGNATVSNIAGLTLTLSTKTSDYSMVSESIILADGTSNDVTITLPDASGVSGQTRWVKRIDSAANTVDVDSAGGTIDGSSSIELYSQYAYIQVVSDGTNWHIIATSLMLG